MEITYKKVISKVEPIEIDITSSPDGVYVRRDIKTITKENGEDNVEIYFEYQEAYLTRSEYEVFANDLIAAKVNGEKNTTARDNFVNKLNTPVIYPANGLSYCPIYYEVYENELNKKGLVIMVAEKVGKNITPILSQTFAVYDSTELEENMRRMTISEIIDLYFYLLAIKEQYFEEYKAEKTEA